MLEIVYSQGRRFPESHGAEVSGDFQSLGMRMLHRHFELFGLDAHESFERCHAFRCPIVDRAAGILRVRQRMKLRQDAEQIAEVRSRDAQLRARLLALVDQILEG